MVVGGLRRSPAAVLLARVRFTASATPTSPPRADERLALPPSDVKYLPRLFVWVVGGGGGAGGGGARQGSRVRAANGGPSLVGRSVSLFAYYSSSSTSFFFLFFFSFFFSIRHWSPRVHPVTGTAIFTQHTRIIVAHTDPPTQRVGSGERLDSLCFVFFFFLAPMPKELQEALIWEVRRRRTRSVTTVLGWQYRSLLF